MKKWTATQEEIQQGKTTDVYFLRTKEILQKDGLDKTKVWAEVTTGGIPRDGKRLIFLGLQEVIDLFVEAKLNVNLYAIDEGTILPNKDINGVKIPFMIVEGEYGEFALFETPMLGLMCFQSGVGTSAVKIRVSAEDRTLLSFGIRRMPPSIAPIIDRACYIAGFDGISCILSSEKLGIPATGTIPHALIMLEGGIGPTMQSYNKIIDPKFPRIALSDTFNDEKIEVLEALEAIGNRLNGVRLDTPSSRRGNIREIIQEIRWELKLRKREDIKVFLSGGLNEENVIEYKDVVDGFGIGTYVSNSPTIDFAFDIVNIEGKDIAKRGKFAGKKNVGFCSNCQEYLCYPVIQESINCPKCEKPMENRLRKYMENGKIIQNLPKEAEIREFVAKQLLENPKL